MAVFLHRNTCAPRQSRSPALFDAAPQDPEDHLHHHAKAFPLRALAAGMMQGMAGSAALLLLTARAAESVFLSLLQIAVFGVGSMLGMGALSAVIA